MSKELNKAPVEQAGGDERVKCAVCVDSGKVYDISGEGPWKCYACTGSHEVVGYANGDELDNMLDDRTAVLSPVKTSFHTVPVYREARDALEQPSGEVVVTKNESGAIVSVTRQDKEGRVLSVIAESQPSPVPTEGFTHFPELLESVQQMDAMLKANSAQAEAERPEVVAWRYGFSGGIVSDKACLDEWKSGGEYQSLMTVAQHERIVGALRAVIAQLRQHKNDYMDSGQETYRALQNEIREREAEIARLDGLVSGRTAERDAALAKVERLRESKGDPSGSFDRCMKMMYERDENAKRLDAALARVAELEKGTVYVEARQCDECQHVGINDSADGLAACHDCDWTGPEPDEDKCPDCQRENCMAAACPQCGARYVLVASEEIAAPVAQAQQLHDLDKQCRDDVARALGLRPNEERGFAWSYLLASIKSCVKAAQAQHSVPEGWMLVECGIWTQEQVDEMQRTVARFRSSEFVDDRALAMAVADAGQCKAPEISLAELLAAAPGKEGV